MRFITAFVILVGSLWPAPLVAQEFKTSANPVSDAVRQLLARDSKNLVASADLMPAEKYRYSTTASYLRLNGILPPTAQPKK